MLDLATPYPEYKTTVDYKDLPKKEQAIIKIAQGRFIDTVMNSMQITIRADGWIHTSVRKNDESIDLTDSVSRYLVDSDGDIEALFSNQVYLSKAIEVLSALLSNHKGVAVVLDAPINYPNGPSIAYRAEDNGARFKSADKIITTPNSNIRHLSTLREIIRFGQLRQGREKLQREINNGRVNLVPRFRKDRWPIHPLMNHIKASALPSIIDEVRSSGIMCDEQDIRYQTLFRLSTLPITELFEAGEHLEEYLIREGAYFSWRHIPTLNPVLIEQFRINEEIVRETVREQLVTIDRRMQQSRLPVLEILQHHGIYAEKGWEVIKDSGETYAVNKITKARKNVYFRVLDPDLARSYHGDLHYIHTPRVDISFGLYLDGEDLPFSVLGIQKVDRDYKRNVLLALGYDPDECFDFTRLYSRPGVPFNTSTAIFGSTYSYLRENMPQSQAALSAFMPTYASGLSMISGGFSIPVLLKEGRQFFQSEEDDVYGTLWTNRTNRRRISGQNTRSSVIPMLPTIELIYPIKKPRFEPLNGVTDKMFDLTE